MSSSPPFYVLLAHSSLSSAPSAALSNTLGHPVIQYHYADDSPLSLLPTHPDEHILVLNYSNDGPKPTVQSISPTLSVVGLKTEEAPGASVADETGTRNDTMFIIETSDNDHLLSSSHGDRKSGHAIIAQFKHRNQVLRKALQYPNDQGKASSATAQPPIQGSPTTSQPSS
ncbi:hypothetical protein D9613_001959 [Agrocybe pediades]|uniref:Uncharacterized protein n=1 Tax=Agrocybe pediades TaxID=84607 RepID=A0A8H4R6W9_9AGAR|nr:hypothetical protein D9613_001959 [Agrocybe pediades]